MQVVVNGAELGRLVVIPAYLDQTHAQNQQDVLVTDKQNPSKSVSRGMLTFHTLYSNQLPYNKPHRPL
jgi:hypothetical protein